MTDIEWGAEIAVNGKRPEWLRDEDKVNPIWDGKSEYGQAINNNKHIACIERLSHIRLPANHPYYLATSRGFTYWPGGDSEPEDWDGGEVLLSDNSLCPSVSWWQRTDGMADVIGYRKRIEQPAPTIAPELVERIISLLRNRPHDPEAQSILELLAPDPDLTLAKSIVGDAEAIALAIKAARGNGR